MFGRAADPSSEGVAIRTENPGSSTDTWSRFEFSVAHSRQLKAAKLV